MKIYVNYDPDNHTIIRGIQTLSYFIKKGKTEDEIDSLVKKRNEEAGWEIFRIFKVDDELEKVVRFLLGEQEYKRYADITYVYDKLKDIKDDVDSMRDDTFHMSEYLDTVIDDVRKIIPEDD